MTNSPELITNWRKSSLSADNSTCVEVGWSTEQVGYRDTKQAGLTDDARPVLLFGKAASHAFLRAAVNGVFDQGWS
jgi:hypothetical protein